MCATGCHDWRHTDSVLVGQGANLCCEDWDEVEEKYCERTIEPDTCSIAIFDESINLVVSGIHERINDFNGKLFTRAR